jgi:DNA-directed RNA polymerase specialized sigma24 family protein
MSLDIGRVPSCLPREFARARRTSARGPSFEDRIIFVHDIERCMQLLDSLALQILTRVALQEYSRKEAAVIFGMTLTTLSRTYDDALDMLSTVLLGHGLMDA